MAGSPPDPVDDWQQTEWQSFIDRLPLIVPFVDLACLLTPEQRLLHIDPESAEKFDLPPEEVVGRPCYEIAHGQSEPIDECPCPETVATGRPAVGDVFEEDGRYYLPATAPIFDSDGRLRAVAHSVSDVTEQHRTHRAYERYREFLDYTHKLAEVGGWELDCATETLRWTDGTRRIHEVESDFEPTLETALAFFHAEDRASIERAVRRCREDGRTFDLEARLVTANDAIRWVRCSGERIVRDGNRLLRGAIRDVTTEKQRTQRLSVLNRIFRHNIRNAMTVISGYAGMIHDATENDSLQQFADTIDAEAAALIAMSEKETTVGDLFRRGPPSDARCDVVSILEMIRPAIERRFPSSSIHLETPNQCLVRADDRIALALREALDNALRHSDRSDPTVTVVVRQSESATAPNWVTVAIADDGPGVPRMEMSMIQAGHETPLNHGTGIGLWVIHWVVSAFGGEWTIEENDPRGSIVTIRLPAVPEDGRGVADPPAESQIEIPDQSRM